MYFSKSMAYITNIDSFTSFGSHALAQLEPPELAKEERKQKQY